jgi:methylated-DNA-[protein]-cysteine S-methyltransferase
MDIHTAYLRSLMGLLEIKGNEEGIRAVEFIEDRGNNIDTAIHSSLTECCRQLGSYFEGELKSFDIKLNPEGTEFQKQVWKELLAIPFGKTRSYLQVAEKIADKNATREVGSANGKNPIAIIVPCHRVIGHNGKLTGYAGGLWRKEWLLKHEGVLAGSKQLMLF